MISDTSSAPPPRHKPVALFKRSPYAIASTPDGELGSYGCVLLKPMRLRVGGWREGEELKPGTIVPGHVAANWPLQNRLALKEGKFVRFFLSPDEAAEAGVGIARTAQTHPERAQVQAGIDEEERKRANRLTAALNLAKAREAKAVKKAFAGVPA